DLLLFPNMPGRKTYPRPDDPAWRIQPWKMEGLRRTMSVAAPLMHADPEMCVGGYRSRDYDYQLLVRAKKPGTESIIPYPEDVPYATYQLTCEPGGLAMLLLLVDDVIWPYLKPEEQQLMAVKFTKWGHHRTTQNNWRYFNIMMLTFLKKKGYPI